ncbi:unnamed protein product, partial [Phaeothamnion confervicola]
MWRRCSFTPNQQPPPGAAILNNGDALLHHQANFSDGIGGGRDGGRDGGRHGGLHGSTDGGSGDGGGSVKSPQLTTFLLSRLMSRRTSQGHRGTLAVVLCLHDQSGKRPPWRLHVRRKLLRNLALSKAPHRC